MPTSDLEGVFLMKIAVSSYSFMGAIKDGRMGLMDVIPKAKEMGFEAIEVASIASIADEIRASAQALRAQSKAYNMPICAYLTSADFLAPDLDAEVKKMQKEVEVTALLGAPRMRHDACWQVDPSVTFESALPRIVEGYRRVTEYACGLGVHTMIENHGFFTQDSDRVEAIVKGVDHKNFGWLVDMGNFLCADEDPEHAVAVAAPYAVHVHAKDFHIKPKAQRAPELGWFDTRSGNHLRGAMFGHGNMNLAGVMALLKNAGYDGWISLEYEGIEDCLMAIPEGLKNLKTYL